MFFEQAFCSGVRGRSNLTAAAAGVSMTLAPLQCGYSRFVYTREDTALKRAI
jgi:hypothetical protein